MGIFDRLKDRKKLKGRVFEDELLYLKKYHKDVELVSCQIENITELPEAWKKRLLKQSSSGEPCLQMS